MLVPCNLLAQRVRPWSVLGSSGVRTGVFAPPLPVSSSCECTKRRRSFVMVSIEAHSMGSPIRLRFGLISPYARVRCENNSSNAATAASVTKDSPHRAEGVRVRFRHLPEHMRASYPRPDARRGPRTLEVVLPAQIQWQKHVTQRSPVVTKGPNVTPTKV